MAKIRYEMKNILPPPVAGHEAHIWQIELDLMEPDIRSATAFFCDDERKRADRLFSPEHRRRFIAAHSALRVILGGYLGIDPENVAIMPGADGKPGLGLSSDYPYIFFNLSHSGGIAIIGISAKRAIGVDVEHLRPVSGMDGICRRFFAKPEARLVESAPGEAGRELFFRLWTMKEACLKASGKGLRGLGDLPQLVAEADDGTSPALVPDTACLAVSGRSWSVRRIFAATGYEAAVALEGDEPWDVIYRRM